jgi:hypothetical protein
MFDGLVPGAMSPVSGIVTLLMTAKILASIAQNLSDTDSHQGEWQHCRVVMLFSSCLLWIGLSMSSIRKEHYLPVPVCCDFPRN